MRTEQLLEALSREFPVDDVTGADPGTEIEATGFVWTSRPRTLVLAANRRYAEQALANPDVAAVLVPPSVRLAADAGKMVIVSPESDQCFYFLHNAVLNEAGRCEAQPPEVDPTAVVEPGAHVGPGVTVGAGVRIGANATVLGPARIEEGAVIEAGAVVGCDGLFAKRIRGKLLQVRHYGGTSIGAGAWLHSGAVIVRSAMLGEATRIGERAHVGVMANVGHDAAIGAETVMSSNVVIAGRAVVGERVWIGASATISNAVKVGDGARINLGAVCIRDVPGNTEVSGNFATDHASNMRRYLKGG